MGKKQPHTPRSQIKSALRQLFLRSRERARVLKRDKNICQTCFKKGSVAKGKEVKVQVHHLHGVMWNDMIDFIYKHLLVDPKHMICMCKECHEKEHKEE